MYLSVTTVDYVGKADLRTGRELASGAFADVRLAGDIGAADQIRWVRLNRPISWLERAISHLVASISLRPMFAAVRAGSRGLSLGLVRRS